jgi:putative transposase
VFLTFKYRVKDGSAARRLRRQARAVNQVWNFCCATQREAENRRRAGRNLRWPSAYDLIRLCTGSGAELGLHSDTVQTICRQFAASRDARRRCPRFRASGGPKRALGWIPFIPRAVKIEGEAAIYLGGKYRFWKSREWPGNFKAGCFVQDARGRWYISLQCEVSEDLPTGAGQIGIDLGLKILATCSDGTKIPALQHYRQYEAALAKAQRARNSRRVKAIHAKIANARRHHLHGQSTRIARENELIVVGNVSPTKLTKTRMAKSVLDASWSVLRSQLAYKARRHGARYIEADERWTTQTCSCCGVIPASSPKGMGALGIRHWVCSCCGSAHDRDLNAAKNILRVGAERRPLAEEIPVLLGREDVKAMSSPHDVFTRAR